MVHTIQKNMLKDDIAQILDRDKERIKNSFCIEDEEINKIKGFLNKDHKDFRSVIDDLSASNLSDRGKMVICCLMGYVNAMANRRLEESDKRYFTKQYSLVDIKRRKEGMDRK